MNNFPLNPPPRRNELPIIQKLIATYALWQQFTPHFPKTSRYTLGAKIDSLFLDIIEEIFSAAPLTPAERLAKIKSSSLKLDSIKFFLQIAWQIKSLDTKKYAALSGKVDEVGKMLGGWLKQLLKNLI